MGWAWTEVTFGLMEMCKGWHKFPNLVWTSLKTSKTVALINFPQGIGTRGTLNWLTRPTIGFFLATTAAILSSAHLGGLDQYHWVGLTPDVSSLCGSVLEGGGSDVPISSITVRLGTWLKLMQIQILSPTASLIFTAAKLFHQVICERTKHKVSTASYP